MLDKNYTTQGTKVVKGLASELAYRQMIGTGENDSNEELSMELHQDQIEIGIHVSRQSRKEQQELLFEDDARRSEAERISSSKAVTTETRYRFLKVLKENIHAKAVTRKGVAESVGVFFLKHPGRESFAGENLSTIALMKLLDTGRETESLQVLHEHLLRFCGLFKELDSRPTLRNIERLWAKRICQQLRFLSLGKAKLTYR